MPNLSVSTNFPQGFANGLSVRGMPLLQAQPGSVFYLNNSTNLLPNQRGGSDGNRGTFLDPFATLSFASSMCVAGRGDIIFVGAGHAESISSATALTLSIAGVAVIGLGSGELRPTFTLNTANTATINVTANDVSFQNCVFIGNFLAIASLFTLTTAKNFAMIGCEVRDTSSALNILAIVTTSITSNANDGLMLVGNKITSLATAGAVLLVSALGTNDRWYIKDNFYLAVTTGTGAVIPIAAGKVLTNFYLLNNYFNLQNAVSTATGVLLTTNGSTNTGFIAANTIHALPSTPILCTASSGFVYNSNLYADTADLQGYLVPAADV